MNYLHIGCLLAVSLIAVSCGKIMDGSTSDGASLETAAKQGDTTGGGGSGGSGNLVIFTGAVTHSGNFGGTSGADSFCNSDAAKPAGGGTYKALLGATTRAAPSRKSRGSGIDRHCPREPPLRQPSGLPDSLS